MKSVKHVGALRPGADPFDERMRDATRLRVNALGCSFDFVANDRRLQKLVKHAYARLPQRANSNRNPHLTITLRLAQEPEKSRSKAGTTPPEARYFSGAGCVCGMIDSRNFVLIAPQQCSALVVVSQAMLKNAYYVRYEMIEFAVYMLAARVQGHVPLHAACIGRKGRGVLIIGESGAGKSTLALHCLVRGLRFVAEDSVLIEPKSLMARGVGTFLHLRVGAKHFLNSAPRWIRNSPVIKRRSGVRKHEIDVRATPFEIAPKPMQIASIVFLTSRRPASKRETPQDLLVRLNTAELHRRLASTQVYGASQPGWAQFVAAIGRRKAYILHRARHPAAQAEAIESLLR